MNLTLERHQNEIQRNKGVWDKKAILRQIYAGFYDRISKLIRAGTDGRVLEIGSGMGNLKSRLPHSLSSDLFFNPWLDLVCDAYEIPVAAHTISHLILFDVLHHLQAPACFLKEARRVLVSGGRLIFFEPFLSWVSFPVYGLLHPEPIAWRREIDPFDSLPRPRRYYAAQGNATRIFFRRELPWFLEGWMVFHAEALASFSYLLSGGFSQPSFCPEDWLPWLQRLDGFLSRWPKLFGARCLVGLTPKVT